MKEIEKHYKYEIQNTYVKEPKKIQSGREKRREDRKSKRKPRLKSVPLQCAA